MKKAIWINPVSTGSTSLDQTVNPHDCDSLALSTLLEKDGFEVWLQEPYKLKSKQSNYPRKVTAAQLSSFDADIAIINMNRFYVNYVNKFHNEGNQSFEQVMEWLMDFKGEIFIFVTDPRKKLREMLTVDKSKFKPKTENLAKCVDKIVDIFHNSRLIAATDKFFEEEHRHRVVTAEYWKLVEIKTHPYNPTYKFNSVYVGMKDQTPYRRKMITNWIKGDEQSFTAGPIEIKGHKSLTKFKPCPVSDTIQFAYDSKTVLACSEEDHHWLTPRILQSLVCGSIASIHPDLPCRDLLPQDILDEQTFAHISDFNDDLLDEKVYQRQLDFANNLKNTVKPIELGIDEREKETKKLGLEEFF